MNKKKIILLILSIVISFLAALIGNFFTTPAIPDWYASLIKPNFNPPNWIFGPVWSVLYLLIGISLFLVINKGVQKKSIQSALIIFGIQWFLNVSWSVVFFGYHNLLLALINIVLLWIFILITIIGFYKIEKLAGWILIPYLLWVSFASVLNLFIYLLN